MRISSSQPLESKRRITPAIIRLSLDLRFNLYFCLLLIPQKSIITLIFDKKSLLDKYIAISFWSFIIISKLFFIDVLSSSSSKLVNSASPL